MTTEFSWISYLIRDHFIEPRVCLRHSTALTLMGYSKDFDMYGNMLFTSLTPHITGSKKQSEERAALLAVRVHVIVGHLSISAETLMAQVDQVSSIPDSSALLTSVAPRVGKFESLGVSENLLQ